MTRLPARPSFPDEAVLLHELNHRVNNEFAAAISVVSLAAARSANNDVKTALTTVTKLLHDYASVHRALQMPENDAELDAEAHLRQLCFSISRSHLDNRKINLVLAVEPLRLRADVSWRLGMIVYELIINAMRHAFEGDGGEIRVAVRRDGAVVKCSVQDNGSTAAHIRPGQGLKIVDALSSALAGRFRQAFGPGGSRSLLVFPCTGASNTRRAKLSMRNGANFVRDAGQQRATRGNGSAMCR
jgi:two-component sensor histidine kinase